MSDIAQLLTPVSAECACGEDLSFAPELDAIARARQHDDPTLDQGEWVTTLKEADWPFVAARCALLLETRSKDLQLAVWLAEAWAKTRQFRGLGDGYALLAGLCERYWGDLYPAAEDGDCEQRIGNLYWLLARAPRLCREMALSEGAGRIAMADFDTARQRALNNQAEPGCWGDDKPDPGVTVAQLEAQRQQNTPRYNLALLADAEYCLDSLLELERVADRRLELDSPSFRGAREGLENIIHFITPPAAAGHEAGAQVVPHGAGLPAPGVSFGGAIEQRAQALAQLRLVADFFRRTEPHSPVAYLADKAAHWGELPLHLWLRAVVKDPDAIAQLEELLGAENHPS